MFFKRIAFIDFLKGMIMSSRESHANEIREKILPKMCSYIQFVEAFTPAMSHAAVGAGNLVELEEAAEAEDASGKGLANAAAKEFDAFVDGLTPRGKPLRTFFRRRTAQFLIRNSGKSLTSR